MIQEKLISLNKNSFFKIINLLEEQDQDLKMIVSTHGVPPFWRREQGFQSLLYIILEQQVSLASAKATYDKLVTVTRVLTPESFMNLNNSKLKTIGFSRQKTQYGRNLAESILENKLDLPGLIHLKDSEVKEKLMKIKGIGPWSADIYLLLAMCRPDIWPGGDLAIAIAIQQLKGLASKPTVQELADLSIKWKPWRSVAARLLWHFYLRGNR